jgi:hypothetical protein
MAVAIVALVAALGGVAVASPIGGDGKVYLCYSQEGVDVGDGNQVVAVNAGSACPAEYPQALLLNQTGPTGVPGPSGPTGAPGPQGPGGQKLPQPISQDLIDDLKKADKLADKNIDRLKGLKDKLKLLEDSKDRQEQMLALRQRQMIEALMQITNAITQIGDANRKVVQRLD